MIDTDSSNHLPTRRAQLLFIVVTILFWCSMYTYVPILSPYLESIGFSYAVIGIVLGSYGLMQLIIRFPLGLFSDRIRKRKPFILLGFLTSALGCGLFIVFQDPLGVTAARAMTGISASTWVAFTVLYASSFSAASATKAMSTLSVATVAGQLLGMGASGFLAQSSGWMSTFWLGAASAAVGGILSLCLHEPKEGISRTPIRLADLATVARSTTLLRVSTLSVLAHIILFVTMFGFTPSYAVHIGANQSALSLLVFAFMLPHAAASWLAGNKLTPRFGAWRVVCVGFILSGLCTLSIPVIPTLGLLYATQALNGFAQGLHLPLLLGLSIENVGMDRRATAMGFYQAVYAAGMFSGPFIAGWLNESYGLTGGFVFGGIAAIIAVLLISLWGRTKKEVLGG